MNLSVEISGGKVVYKPGEIIAGNVVVDSTQSGYVKSLQITCKGSAKVQWTESHGKSSTTYTGKQKFCSMTIQLVNQPGGQTISAGRSTFPFQFQLPPNIASSLEVQHGYIRYRLKVTLQGPSTKRAKVFFTVVEEVNLNHIPHARQPSSGEDSKTLCCWCCASGLIEGKVNTDVMGVVPGQYVTASGSVENGSNSDLSRCRLRIVQVAVLHASAWGFSKTRTVERYLTSTEFAKRCRKKSMITMPPEKIQVPTVSPSHQKNCNIIDLEYFVELTGQTPRCHFNLKVRAPLEIGSIPLDQGQTQMDANVGGIQSTQFSGQPPSYGSVVPGSTLQGQDNPYYNWEQQSAFTYNN